MAIVLRRASQLAAPLLAAGAVAGCGSSASSAPSTSTAAAAGPSLAASPARTAGAGTARFTMKVAGTLGSGIVTTYANGALSFGHHPRRHSPSRHHPRLHKSPRGCALGLAMIS